MNMPNKRLLRGEVTYSDVNQDEFNILHQLHYYDKQVQYFAYLYGKRNWMKEVVAHHLNLSTPSICEIAEPENWLQGSFNVCVPINIRGMCDKRVLLRFPLPYKVGEAFNPGNGDEKIRCEAGTYAWLEENCPQIPIPQLYGFALSSGDTVRPHQKWVRRLYTELFYQFTRLDCLPLIPRWYALLRRRVLKLLQRPVPSNYILHHKDMSTDGMTPMGYILVEFIEKERGQMLSDTWQNSRHNPNLRMNFFRDLARIFIHLCRCPLPTIGSFKINKRGFLELVNRPLSIEIHQLENELIPTEIPRDYTYSTVDSYVVDILNMHDNRFRYQPNAVNNTGDCAYQLSVLTAMRTIFQTIFDRSFRRGPFVFTFTDFHQSNIFVDANWNITCLVDLEWACSRPIEMLLTPFWLTDDGVDELVPSEYAIVRREFIDVLTFEEDQFASENRGKDNNGAPSLRPSQFMNRAWNSGAFWYAMALSSPSALFTIFSNHIKPLFCKEYDEEFGVVMPFFFAKHVGHIAGRKLADKKKYDCDLRSAFEH